jgi:hypothetical protein
MCACVCVCEEERKRKARVLKNSENSENVLPSVPLLSENATALTLQTSCS